MGITVYCQHYFNLMLDIISLAKLMIKVEPILEGSFNDQNKAELEVVIDKLEKVLNNKQTLITLSELGVFIKNNSEKHHIPAHHRSIADVSGAGDTAISAFVLADLSGASIEESAMISNYAAGRVCEEVGVVPISIEMIKEIYMIRIMT